ncbi:MAG: S1 family peptidase [Chloroflexota bacterium]|nr:S1 family peptidase [Chloroflexota bacterium]
MSRIRSFGLLAVLAALLLAAAPAGAIQYGERDNDAHPYVGGAVFEVDGARFVGCSGTLIGPTTFLTAAHCAPDDSYRLVGVTFDDAFTPGESKIERTSKFVSNPKYDGTAATDVAVILLRSDPGVSLAKLPKVGLLDTLAPSADAGDQDRYLTAVGYGTTGLDRGTGGGRPDFVYPDVRMRSENTITGLTPPLVRTTAAPGTGGGTCYGDSGGPFFVAGTNVVVATTITGSNINCGGSDINLRIDTAEVQRFLSRYL